MRRKELVREEKVVFSLLLKEPFQLIASTVG